MDMMKEIDVEKETYETPAIQIVEVKVEGIVCASDQNGTGEGFTWDS